MQHDESMSDNITAAHDVYSASDGFSTASESINSERIADFASQPMDGQREIDLNDDAKQIIKCVHDLKFKERREHALVELSKKRDCLQNLAPVIWHSVGTISALLQEIISIYPYLDPSKMTSTLSNRTCNVLALLQCVAAHPDTRSAFIKANIPLFLYPFLNTISKGKAYEYLRLTSLGVIGALVKVDNPEFIHFLLHTEIIPLSLRIMERGTELSQTVATFIIQKILTDSTGLNYICQTKQRFFTVITVLNTMVNNQKQTPSQRLLKHIARCYQKLLDNNKAKDHLAENYPTILTDETLENSFDENTKIIIDKLRSIVQTHREMMESRKNQQDPRYHMMNKHPGQNMMGVDMEQPGMTHGNMHHPHSGRTSADIGQPMFPRPNSTSYQPHGGQMYGRGQRPFVPGQGSQPMMRPGSTNTSSMHMNHNMVPHMMNAQSPPMHHASSQPVMMPYMHQMPVSPTPMSGYPSDPNGDQMMRMNSNQSPYYPQMAHASQPGYHPSGMMSPGMMQPPQNNMYYPSMGTQYRPVPRKGVPQRED